MNTVLLCFVLAQTPSLYPDGSLLFVENGNTIVMNQTGSTLSHVAVILREGENYVYEADKPKVRKVSLSKYIEEIRELNRNRERHHQRLYKLWIMIPRVCYDCAQIDCMRSYLNDNLGRRYGIASYLNGYSMPTIHCGELTTGALRCGGLLIQSNPCTNTPVDVWCACRPFYTWKKIFP